MRRLQIRRTNPSNLFLFFGSLLTLIVSLFTAYIPGLAYTTVHSYFADVRNPPFVPYAQYYPLYFSTHIYTISYLLSAMGGLLGFLAFFSKGKKVLVGASGIVIAILGLMLPVTNRTITIPEARLFDVLWIGGFVITVGICLMFIGITLKNEYVPKASYLSLPLLIAGYSFLPILIILNYFPWVVFGAPTPSVIQLVNALIPFAAIILMIWGIVKSKPFLQ